MGLIVDKDLAARTPCHGYKMPDGELLLWSPGIIGMLSDPQEKAYCTKIETEKRSVSPALERRWRFFKESSRKCSAKVRMEYPRGERLSPFLKCMSIEAKKSGIEI